LDYPLTRCVTARIDYASIERVWRHYLPATVVLRVATEKRVFEIVSVLLPDNESYCALDYFSWYVLRAYPAERSGRRKRKNLKRKFLKFLTGKAMVPKCGLALSAVVPLETVTKKSVAAGKSRCPSASSCSAFHKSCTME